MTPQWPEARMSDIERLHVLSAGLPGTAIRERTIPFPFERVWGWVGDLERSAPFFDRDVAAIEIRRRDGEHLEIVATAPWHLGRARFALDVDLRPGWCWMVARNGLYVVGMAAEPDGDDTRFAHLEGVTVRGPAWLRAAFRPVLAVSRWRHERHLVHDLDGMERGIHLAGD
jgi:hypothetical protein